MRALWQQHFSKKFSAYHPARAPGLAAIKSTYDERSPSAFTHRAFLLLGFISTALTTPCILHLFLGTIANDALGYYVDYFSRVHVVENVLQWMAYAPGPFEVFTGSWSLIDV